MGAASAGFTSATTRRDQMPRKLAAVSLFSGAGGFEIGFQRAGVETVLQAEIDPWAQSVLRRHWPEIQKVNDVRDISANGLQERGLGTIDDRTGESRGTVVPGQLDLVYGGFPCQPFSVAGQRVGDRDDRNLWPEFRRVVRELRPRWIVAENVPGLLSFDQGRFFGSILDDLGELGFEGVAYAVLDARYFHVPQRRERVFVVAGPTRRSAEEILSICEGCGGNPPASREAREGVAAILRSRSASSGVNLPGRGGEDDANLIAFGVNGGDIGYAVRAGASRSGDKGDGGLNTTLVAAPLAGHHRDDLDNDLRRHPRPGSNSIGLTETATGVRRLMPIECERLMGWPDDWTRWTDDGREIPDTHRYRLIGNGVVSTVAEWIGRRLVAVDDRTRGKT